MITQQDVSQVAYTLLKKCRLIAVEVSSQQAVVVDRKVMQQINLLSFWRANIARADNWDSDIDIYLIYQHPKKYFYIFSRCYKKCSIIYVWYIIQITQYNVIFVKFSK